MPGRDLNLLALEGGGVRGLSALQILKVLVERVADANGLDDPPKPCEYFDMIAGTGTGGLVAIMLGRLRMTVDECITAYVDVSDRVFQKRQHRVTIKGNIRGRFDTDALEREVKRLVTENCKLPEDELLRDAPNAQCRVVVCAMSQRTMDIVPLTSYRRSRGGNDRLRHVKIWEAARATSAASSFFDEIPIKMGSYIETFINGATGANNPIRELWNEAKDFWEPESLEQNLNVLVSIGTGVPSVEAFDASIRHIVDSLTRISTETERTAESFQRDHSSLDDEKRYFRFNVSHGLENVALEDAAQKDAIMIMTGMYLELQEVHKSVRSCAQALKGRECGSLYA